jgi:glycosyltransferase involved in cell wall biosynthesis
MSISVLILTLNEESNLPRCLESVAWSNDIVVFDSFSADRTVEVAKAAGARIVQRKFDNWSSHQNWAVSNIEFRHPWVYYSDADERVTPELAAELRAIASDVQREEVAYRVRFKNMFMGRWIRRSSLYPTWVLRFFRPECVRWERLVNPVPIVKGKEGKLRSHFEHYTFNKGLTEWLHKHNLYSQTEANELIKTVERGVDWKGLLAIDPAMRRKSLKELAFHIPFRPLIVFCYVYLLRGGFLDGIPGLTYCRLRAMYEFMIDLKVKELRRGEKGLPV